MLYVQTCCPGKGEVATGILYHAPLMERMKIITNNMVGATQEDWFKFKGEELIEFIKNKKQEIINLIAGIYNENFY